MNLRLIKNNFQFKFIFNFKFYRLNDQNHQFKNDEEIQKLIEENSKKGLLKLNSYASICELNSKAVIQFNGFDSQKILQGIFTNDMNLFNKEPQRKAIHGCFLNDQGRIIADAVIIRPQVVSENSSVIVNKEREFWIQVDKSQLNQVKSHLQKYSIRRKVQIIDISQQLIQLAIYSHFLQETNEKLGYITEIFENSNNNHQVQHDSSEVKQSFFDKNLSYTDIYFNDPRSQSLGKQFITLKDDDSYKFYKENLDLNICEEKDFNNLKLIQGIVEGKLIENMLPFVANFDFLNSLSYNKGCYLGQEIVSRAYYTGIIRKRIMPFKLSKEYVVEDLKKLEDFKDMFSHLQRCGDQSYIYDNDTIQNLNGDNVGKIIFKQGGLGLAIIDYFKLDDEQSNIGLKVGEYYCYLLLNNRLFKDLQKYKQQVQEKLQKNQEQNN